MRTLRWMIPLLLLLLVAGLGAPVTRAAPSGQEWAIPGGYFFTQAAGGQGGFSVLNDGQARFWSEFQRLGGVETVGYPISRRFERAGFVTQAFQKLVLQWRPEVAQAWPVNLLDEFYEAGLDDYLLLHRQTPRHSGALDVPGATWEQVVAGRQRLLDANPAIRARYVAAVDPLTTFGVPTSSVEDMGNHYAIRTQRAVFQQWKEAVPWAAAGQVTVANAGNIARELGWLAVADLLPEDPATFPPAPPPTRAPAPTLTPGPTPALSRTNRWIDVDISSQTIRAYEGNNVVYSTLVSTGRRPYPTVTGEFSIWAKLRYDDMQGGSRERGDTYYLKDVPYVMYFYGSYAIHGTYWHSNFGTPMSHGCVNLSTTDARWFFDWADVGTAVVVHP